jgi:hypothetical protein
MRSIGEVFNYIEITIVPNLRLLEKKMSTEKMVAWVYLITFAVGFASVIYGNILLFFVCFFILLVSFYFAHKIGKASCDDFQKDVLKPLLSFIDPQIKYYQEGGMSEKEFVKSHFVNESISTYENKNYITYRTQKYTLHCGDVEAKQYNGKDSENILYHGLFAYVKVPNAYSGDIVVMPDYFANMFGSFIKEIVRPHMLDELHKITIDNGEFDHTFTVYSSHKDEARRLFDDMRLRDILLAASKKIQYGLRLTFSGDKIYIGAKPSFFEFGIDMINDDARHNINGVKQSVQMFYTAVDIVEYLYQSNESMSGVNR